MQIAASNAIHHFDCLKTLLLTISTTLLSSCCPQPPSLFPSCTMFPGVQILVFWIAHSLRMASWISTPDLYTNSECLHVYTYFYTSPWHLKAMSNSLSSKWKQVIIFSSKLLKMGLKPKTSKVIWLFPFLSYSVIQPRSLKAAPSYLRESNSLR